MELGTLLNQNIKIVEEVDGRDTIIKLINTSNEMELATIWVAYADECDVWLNPGGVMTKEEYDKFIARKELHEINSEMISNE